MKNPSKISMKKLAFSVLAALALTAIPSAHAADATWGANTTGNWTLGSNWSPTTAPGATSGLTNTDNATFSDAAGGTITIDSATQNIGSLLFSGTPAAYIIGSSGANAGNSLLLSSGGTINVTSSNAVNQTVNAPLVLEPASGTTAGSYCSVAQITLRCIFLLFSSGLGATGFDLFQLRPRPINLFHNVLDLCGPDEGFRLKIPVL